MAIKYLQLPVNRPNYHKIDQDFSLQDPQKFTQIGLFWFENKPSGNPDINSNKENLFESTLSKIVRKEREKFLDCIPRTKCQKTS
jgi:hypothetical protein